jgi:nicotinate-nucleotide adenylyltransferase
VRLGVLGGTFDPVHTGHLVLAEQAREQLSLDRVLWVPSGEPWRKAERPVTPAAQRVEMVRLAIAGHPAFNLSTAEADRPGPSYSADTLAQLHGEAPDAGLLFILGSDALADLPGWHEPARLIELATLAAVARDGRRYAAEELERLLPGLAARTVWVDMPRLDISGTELRARAAQGRSLRYLVPDAVEAYIRAQRLYSGP